MIKRDIKLIIVDPLAIWPEDKFNGLISIIPRDKLPWDILCRYFVTQDSLDEWIKFAQDYLSPYSIDESRKKFINIQLDHSQSFSTSVLFQSLMDYASRVADRFDDFHKHYAFILMSDSTSCNHHDVSEYMAFRYFHKYAYSHKKRSWYEKFGNYWYHIDDDGNMSGLRNRAINYYMAWENELKEQLNSQKDQEIKCSISVKIRNLQTLVNKLKNVTYWKQIIYDLSSLLVRKTSFIPIPHHHDNIEPSIGTINIFTPFQYRYEEGKITFDELIRLAPIFNLVQGLLGLEAAEWTECYLADMLQNPHIIPDVGPAYIGERGIGKNTFFVDLFATLILGKSHYFLTPDLNQVVGTFNSNIEGKSAIFLDEIAVRSRADCHILYQKLKQLITGKTVSVEYKGVDAKECANFARTFFLLNPDNTADFVDNDDRRYPIFRCNPYHKGDSEYWKDFRDKYLNQEMANLYAKYLLSIDISNYNPREFPTNSSEFTKQIREINASPIIQFLGDKTICIHDPKVKIASGEFKRGYERWYVEEYETKPSKEEKKAASQLISVRFEVKKSSNNYILGLNFTEEFRNKLNSKTLYDL